MAAAQDATKAALAAAVREYEARFGFTAIIFAAGRSAAQLTDVVQRRLSNPVEQELRVAAEQVMMITRLRLESRAGGDVAPSRGDGRSPITTHILDVNCGKPASGVALRLELQGSSGWRPVSSGVTSTCGRGAVELFVVCGSLMAQLWACVSVEQMLMDGLLISCLQRTVCETACTVWCLRLILTSLLMPPSRSFPKSRLPSR